MRAAMGAWWRWRAMADSCSLASTTSSSSEASRFSRPASQTRGMGVISTDPSRSRRGQMLCTGTGILRNKGFLLSAGAISRQYHAQPIRKQQTADQPRRSKFIHTRLDSVRANFKQHIQLLVYSTNRILIIIYHTEFSTQSHKQRMRLNNHRSRMTQ